MDTKMSDEDTEVARLLLGKKKKKKKRIPFYRQMWFTLSSVAALLAAFGGLVWLLVFKRRVPTVSSRKPREG